jgi:membrane associated rhomboid family serine protease
MSYENRDYAKRDGSPDQTWTRGVQWLVIANVTIFLASFLATKAAGLGPRDVYDLLALVPNRTFHDHRVWQVLTYAFVHDLQNPFHLILNMYILWVAGRDLEFLYGTPRFLKFYFSAAAFSSLLYLLLSALVPQLRSVPLLGASGAAMAVLVVYASYHPGDRILLYLLFEVPIWAGVLVMIGMDLMLVSHSNEGGGFAAGCYVAGAAFGYGAHRLRDHIESVFARTPARTTTTTRTTKRPSAPAAPAAPPPTTLEAELDEVLKKIHEKGMGGLTDDEKGILERASRHYRGKG